MDIDGLQDCYKLDQNNPEEVNAFIGNFFHGIFLTRPLNIIEKEIMNIFCAKPKTENWSILN